jgi:hypothetical protein
MGIRDEGYRSKGESAHPNPGYSHQRKKQVGKMDKAPRHDEQAPFPGSFASGRKNQPPEEKRHKNVKKKIGAETTPISNHHRFVCPRTYIRQ